MKKTLLRKKYLHSKIIQAQYLILLIIIQKIFGVSLCNTKNLKKVINVIDEQKKEEIKKLRDRSIILIGFSGGFRRNEIVSLDYDDLDPDSGNTFATHQITAIQLGGTEGDGDPGTIGEPLKGTYGRLTVFADGSYIYQANNNILDGDGNRIISGDTVTDTFNYTVSDTDGDTDTAVLIITINGTNEPPVAATDYGELDVGGSSLSKTPLTGVTSNDADIEGSDLTVNGIRTGGENDTGTTGNIGSPLTGTYGNITINEDGSYTYELDNTNENLAKIPEGYNFYEIFTYTVTDDTGQTSTAEIVIQINGVNDAPTAVDDEATLDLETSSNLDNLTSSSNFVKANDNDVDLFDNIYSHSVI